MILVDANLLLHAEDTESGEHDAARNWWDAQLSGIGPVALSWPVIKAFLRVGTNPRVLERPLTLDQACERVQSWLKQPCVRIVQPTENPWDVFEKLLRKCKAFGNLVSDAHWAALALEHNCTLYSTGADFGRFSNLRWKNPLNPK